MRSDIKISSNRSFGVVFFIFFLIVSTYPLIKGGEIRIWSLIIALIFFKPSNNMLVIVQNTF